MGEKQSKMSAEEQAKENKRTIQRAIRKIDRERTKMQAQEAKTLKEIKALAQKNQHVSIHKRLISWILGSGQNHVEGSRAVKVTGKLNVHDVESTRGDTVIIGHSSNERNNAGQFERSKRRDGKSQ